MQHYKPPPDPDPLLPGLPRIFRTTTVYAFGPRIGGYGGELPAEREAVTDTRFPDATSEVDIRQWTSASTAADPSAEQSRDAGSPGE